MSKKNHRPPRLPEEIVVGPYTYKVELSQQQINAASVEKEEHLIGSAQHVAQRIVLRPDMGADVTADTLLHEVLHCCFNQGNVFSTSKEEEEAVNFLACILLDTLRRNPGLVDYLTIE